jgi:hypothetical protein
LDANLHASKNAKPIQFSFFNLASAPRKIETAGSKNRTFSTMRNGMLSI